MSCTDRIAVCRRLLVALVAAMLVGSFGVSEAPAQEVAPGDLVREGRPRRADTLDYITIDVREKDLREVLQGIGRQVDVNIVADPEISEKVTVSLDSVEWHKALEIIARQTHCTIVNESPRLIRFTQPPSISMEFQDADLKVVLDLLAKQSGSNIVIAEDVTGKVSVALRNVPWREALETIVKTAGYVTVEDTQGVTDIIRVVRPDTLKQQLETRVIKLKHVRPPEKYRAVIKDVDKQALDREGDEPVDPEKEFTLLTSLRKALSKNGEMDYDATTNTLILKDVKPRLDAIEKIIDKIDVEQALVQVEVWFISTSNDDVLEKGLKFDNPDTPAREGLRIKAIAPPPDQLSADPLRMQGGTFPFDFGRIKTWYNGFSALGVLDFTDTQILLSLVRDDENSKVIQAPKLNTLDNYPSTIFVGQSVPFAVQRVKQDQNGNITVEIDENKRSPINVGFTLYISPHVIPGTDTIHLGVIPKVSSLVGTTSPIAGFDRFAFADPNSASETFIDLPRESSQTVVSYLRVESGHTAVIGGLHTEHRTEIETRVPIISSIPIIGNLLKWKRRATSIDHLLILIKPTIVKNTEISDELRAKAVEEAERDDYFHEKYGTRLFKEGGKDAGKKPEGK